MTKKLVTAERKNTHYDVQTRHLGQIIKYSTPKESDEALSAVVQYLTDQGSEKAFAILQERKENNEDHVYADAYGREEIDPDRLHTVNHNPLPIDVIDIPTSSLIPSHDGEKRAHNGLYILSLIPEIEQQLHDIFTNS